jgi:hypothetical protein
MKKSNFDEELQVKDVVPMLRELGIHIESVALAIGETEETTAMLAALTIELG